MAERVKKMSLSNESVKKLIQELLPEHVLLGKDVQEAVGKAGTMFVLHITDLALKIARKNNRNNLIGQDIMDALEEAGFGEFNKSLKKSLASKLQ